MDFDTQIQLANERRRRAQEIASQGFQAPQGRMVGGRYIRPGIDEALVQGLRQFGAMQELKGSEQEIQDLSARRQKAVADALRNFGQASQGQAPAQLAPEEQQAFAQMGDMSPTVGGVKPDMNAAYGFLMNAPDAALRQAGMQGMLAQATPKPRKMERVELPTPDGGRRVGFVDMNAENPLQTFVEAGTENAALQVGPGGQAYNPRALQPGQVLVDPNKPFQIGPNGSIVPNAEFQGYEITKGRASAPRVSVDARNFNTQESEQSKVYGKGLGEIRTQINQAGYDAPGKLARLDRMEQLLQGIDGGAAAPAIADVASFANSLGIKIDPKLGNKQAAEALAREMAGSLRQPGTGPMTDKDFDNFLRQVPSLSKTAEGRAQIITTMRAAIERDQRASQFARQYAAQNNGVIDDNFFDALAGFYAQNPVVTPQMPATNSRGQPFSDPQKEQRYQEWLKTQGR